MSLITNFIVLYLAFFLCVCIGVNVLLLLSNIFSDIE